MKRQINFCASRIPNSTNPGWCHSRHHQARGGHRNAGADADALELGLLARLGLGPALDRCFICGRTDLAEENTRWIPEQGGVACGSCARRGDLLTATTRQALARLSRMGLADAEIASLDRETNARCRRAILGLIRTHIAGPLRSLDFIEKMGGDT